MDIACGTVCHDKYFIVVLTTQGLKVKQDVVLVGHRERDLL